MKQLIDCWRNLPPAIGDSVVIETSNGNTYAGQITKILDDDHCQVFLYKLNKYFKVPNDEIVHFGPRNPTRKSEVKNA